MATNNNCLFLQKKQARSESGVLAAAGGARRGAGGPKTDDGRMNFTERVLSVYLACLEQWHVLEPQYNAMKPGTVC